MKSIHNSFQKILFTLALMAMVLPLSAQHDEGPLPPGIRLSREKVESLKIAFISRELDLTPQEAQAFWPVYNEFQAKREELSRGLGEKIKAYEEGEMNEKQASEMLDATLAEMQAQTDLNKAYFTKLKTVIPASKILRLQRAEQDFRRVLLRNLQEMRRNDPAKRD